MSGKCLLCTTVLTIINLHYVRLYSTFISIVNDNISPSYCRVSTNPSITIHTIHKVLKKWAPHRKLENLNISIYNKAFIHASYWSTKALESVLERMPVWWQKNFQFLFKILFYTLLTDQSPHFIIPSTDVKATANLENITKKYCINIINKTTLNNNFFDIWNAPLYQYFISIFIVKRRAEII